MSFNRASHVILAAAFCLSAFCSCSGRKPADLPRGYAQTASEPQIARAEQAAREAAETARVVQAQYDKLSREVQELKSQLSAAQMAGRGCADLADKAEKKIRNERALIAKKAAEAAAIQQAQAAPQKSAITGLPVPEYSKSDAPAGYSPPVAPTPK